MGYAAVSGAPPAPAQNGGGAPSRQRPPAPAHLLQETAARALHLGHAEAVQAVLLGAVVAQPAGVQLPTARRLQRHRAAQRPHSPAALPSPAAAATSPAADSPAGSARNPRPTPAPAAPPRQPPWPRRPARPAARPPAPSAERGPASNGRRAERRAHSAGGQRLKEPPGPARAKWHLSDYCAF